MNVLAGEIIAIDGTNRLSRYSVPSPVVTAIRRRRSGGFVIATEREVLIANEELTDFEQIAAITGDPNTRTNDGGCDPFGGFLIGTMSYDEQRGAGAVYRVAPDHRVSEILSPVSISNGIQWSASGTQVFYIDTPTRRVDVFDVAPDTGTWSGRRPHIQLADAAGFPDGMAIDQDNGLWIALWGGGAVNHYDPAGKLVETIGIPGVTQVSSCAFGGDNRDVLYITTSRQGLRHDEEASAGALFAISTESQGAISLKFAG